MNKKNVLLIASLSISLMACSAGHHRPPKEPPPMQDELHTRITPNGLKIFTYSVSMGGPGGHNGGPPSGGGGRGAPPGGGGRSGGGPGGRGNDEFKQMFEQRLQHKLLETGYCRDGYIELGSSMGGGNSFIRGECREGATPKDRDLFPNHPA